MPRATYAVPRRRKIKRLLKQTKGYWGRRSKLHRAARETYRRAKRYAFRDRKARKRVFRSLWIIRISAAIAPYGLCYSAFMGALRRANVTLDRKMLSEMAIQDPKGFEQIVEIARKHLPANAKIRV